MGRAEVESEYHKLKGLVECVSKVLDNLPDELLHEAEMAIIADNVHAMSDIERKLQSMRRAILSELIGIAKQFG